MGQIILGVTCFYGSFEKEYKVGDNLGSIGGVVDKIERTAEPNTYHLLDEKGNVSRVIICQNAEIILV